MISKPVQVPKTKLKGKYEPMNPFVSNVSRASNVRVYDPMSRVYPYSQI